VRVSSLYHAMRQGWGTHDKPPSCPLPAHYRGCAWPLSRPEGHGRHSMSQSSPTTEVTSRAQIARARLGLVTKRRLEVPLERMRGASLWPGRALERQRMTRVLRQWLVCLLGLALGLTPEGPALHLRASTRRPRVDLSRFVTLRGGVSKSHRAAHTHGRAGTPRRAPPGPGGLQRASPPFRS